MIVLLLVLVLTSQAVMAGVLYIVIMEQRRINDNVARIHSAVASIEQRRMVMAMQHEMEMYFHRPVEMHPTPVDILPRIIHNALSNYEQLKEAA